MIGIIGDFIILLANKFHSHNWEQNGEETVVYLAHTNKEVIKRIETPQKCSYAGCSKKRVSVYHNPRLKEEKTAFEAKKRAARKRTKRVKPKVGPHPQG